MGYDDVITLLGDFGSYQRRVYFLLCLPAILCAIHKLGNVFLLAKPNYRCKLPNEILNDTTYSLNHTILDNYFPNDSLTKSYSSCEIILNNKTEKCNQYIFDNSVYGYTSVIEFDLTCKNEHYIATSTSLFMVGVMLGSIGFGEMSDRYGRKLTFFVSLVIQVTFGVIGTFAPEFWTFTFAKLVVGATTSGVFLVAYVIGLEMVGPSKRPLAGTIMHMFFSLGYMFISLFAYFIRDWRQLQFAFTIPGVFFLCYWWFIPESARWLLSRDRFPEAKKLIQVAARANKVEISEETLTSLLAEAQAKLKEKNPNEKAASILDIFRHSNMRKKALIIFFDWFANNIAYYGLSFNTSSIEGDVYLNFAISGFVEIPAYIFLILTLNRWGRRNVMCGGMIFSGLVLLLSLAVPKNLDWLMITLTMVGKLSITASYGAVYIFSSEQFPTVIRNAGLGAGSTCARIASIIVPYVNLLTSVWISLPTLIFAILSLIGGLLSLALPETLNKTLPETIEEGEAFGKKLVKKEEAEVLNSYSNNKDKSEPDSRLLQDTITESP